MYLAYEDDGKVSAVLNSLGQMNVSPSAPTSMEKKPVMVCNKCTLKFAASAKFCAECGSKLESHQEWVMVDRDSVPVATAVKYE